jgi:hypothetical protein
VRFCRAGGVVSCRNGEEIGALVTDPQGITVTRSNLATRTANRASAAPPRPRPAAASSHAHPKRSPSRAAAVDANVRDFVARTTRSSQVPIFVDDLAVLEQIARIMS